MTQIEAVWEKRNLGVDCQELHCSTQDAPEELEKGLTALTAPYQVARVPSGRADLLLTAQKQGFTVMEVSIDLILKMKELPVLPRIYQRFEGVTSIVSADSEQRQFILNEIQNGTIFSTDRIALDPYFSQKLSGERYYYWTKDLITQKNGHLNCVQYKGETVGFSLNFQKEGSVFYAALGGVFEKYARMGLGFLSIYGNNKSIYEQGGRIVETSVSSNNLQILRLHQLYGYDITNMTYILVKHL